MGGVYQKCNKLINECSTIATRQRVKGSKGGGDDGGGENKDRFLPTSRRPSTSPTIQAGTQRSHFSRRHTDTESGAAIDLTPTDVIG